MGAEYNITAKYPNSEVTVKNIGVYQGLMEEMRGEWLLHFTGFFCTTI
jgi:hypothetical protein